MLFNQRGLNVKVWFRSDEQLPPRSRYVKPVLAQPPLFFFFFIFNELFSSSN